MDNENKLVPDASTSADSRQAIFTPPVAEASTTPATEAPASPAETPATPAAVSATPVESPAAPTQAPNLAQTTSSDQAQASATTPAPNQPQAPNQVQSQVSAPTPAPAQPPTLITPTPGSGLGTNPQATTDSDQRHPFFSHHPTQTFNTDTGDIILAHDAPKPSFNKKPFIIGLVVLLIFAIIVFAVLAAVAPKDSSSNNGTGINTTFASQALNKYANYLLYGKDSTQALEGEYDRWEIYTLDEKIESSEEDASYWETAIKLLSEAQNSYQDTVLSKAESWSDEQYDNAEALSNAMAADLDALKMLQAYHGSSEVVDDLILTNYLAGGVDGVKNYIRNLYAPLANADSTAAKAYFEQILQQYELTAQSLDLYRSYGCIVNRAIDESCIDNAYNQNAEIQKIEDKIGDLWVNNTAYVGNIIRRLESNCWIFSDELAELSGAKGGK